MEVTLSSVARLVLRHEDALNLLKSEVGVVVHFRANVEAAVAGQIYLAQVSWRQPTRRTLLEESSGNFTSSLATSKRALKSSTTACQVHVGSWLRMETGPVFRRRRVKALVSFYRFPLVVRPRMRCQEGSQLLAIAQPRNSLRRG